MDDKKSWKKKSQETAVENFYATGIEGFHDYHKGYLNFGYWTKPGMTYVEAAENLVRTMGRKLGLNNTSKLLDCGCGNGTQDILLFQEFNPISIDGLDVTWKHIERARERAEKEHVPTDRVRYHHGSAVNLPFENDSFTHVLSIEAPEHFETREDFFKEAYRVLKPGGMLAICDYSLGKKPKGLYDKFLVKAAQRLWHVPNENVYGNDIFTNKLTAIGFRNVKIDNVGKHTIPGYYYEHRRPESLKEIYYIRGFWKGIVGGYLIDRGVFDTYRRGLCEYIMLVAEKPWG